MDELDPLIEKECPENICDGSGWLVRDEYPYTLKRCPCNVEDEYDPDL